MPSHTCPDGYFWNTETLTCEPIPGLYSGTPATPILVSQDPVLGITLSSGIWDTGVTAVALYRSDSPAILHVFANDTENYTDSSAVTPYQYTYYTKASNGWGYGATPSANLVVETKTTNLSVALTVTDNGTPATGKITVVADVSGTDTLDAANPFELFVNGVSQTVIPNMFNDHQFSFVYDSAAARWAGTIEFKGIAKNNANYKSAPAIATVLVDNSLYFTTRWEIFKRQSEQTYIKAGIYAYYLPQKNDPSDLYAEFRLLSPDPAIPVTEAEKEALFLKAQKVKNKTVVPVNGTANSDGTYTAPNDVLWAIGKLTKTEAVNYYDLGAALARKIRSLGLDEKIVIATSNLKIFKFDINGLTPVVDNSGILTDLAAASDACYISNSEIHIIDGTTLYIADLDAGQKSIASIPENSAYALDTIVPVFVETVNGAAHWIFSDHGETRVYKYVPGATTLSFSETGAATYTYSDNKSLVLGLGTKILLWNGTTVLTYSHSQNITGAQITEVNELQFVDVLGNIYALNNTLTTATLLGTISLQGNALGRFQGAAEATGGAAGGEDNHLFLQDNVGVWAATDAVFEAGATITALERIILTIVEGVGNPLMGGTEPVTQEGLLIGVNKPASAGAYICQYQKVRQTPFQYRVQGVTDIIIEDKK